MGEFGAKWIRDVVTENTALTTTGGHVWEASHRLAEFLEHEQQAFLTHEDGRPMSILELGSGCGWLGLVLARNLPSAACICMTEQETGGGLEWLAHNVELNRGINPGVSRILTRPCDWNDYAHGGEAPGSGAEPPGASSSQPQMHGGKTPDSGEAEAPGPRARSEAQPSEDPSACTQANTAASSCARDAAGPSSSSKAVGRLCPVTGRPWDLILGCDLIYTEGGCKMLPLVMGSLATPGRTQLLYCHTKHRFDNLDLMLMQHLQLAGLSCREVREQGRPSPPPSPPPLTELFPDMRIAVYQISFCNES